VPGPGYQVSGTSYLAPDTRYRINAEDRTPSTEDRVWPPENAHIGFACWSPALGVGRGATGSRLQTPMMDFALSKMAGGILPATG